MGCMPITKDTDFYLSIKLSPCVKLNVKNTELSVQKNGKLKELTLIFQNNKGQNENEFVLPLYPDA